MGWVKRLRVTAAVSALAFLTAACVTSGRVVAPGPTTSSVQQTIVPPGGASPSPSPTPTGTVARARPSHGQTIPGSVPAPAYDDDGAVGAMARTYLRRSPASSLTVEVDWVSGREPSQIALEHLTAVLRRELDKPGGITVRLGNRIASGTSSWSIAALAALERRNRASHSSRAQATMWICYVDGSFAANANALAVSYSASSAAIFRDRIGDASSPVVTAPAIERSVVVHEAGHLLALVNIGYRSRFNHEDPAHPNHSNNPGSVMYWAVEDISIRNVLRGGPPPDFDDADREDLAMLRES